MRAICVDVAEMRLHQTACSASPDFHRISGVGSQGISHGISEPFQDDALALVKSLCVPRSERALEQADESALILSYNIDRTFKNRPDFHCLGIPLPK